ncbi:MAG: 5-formyltetrahydrofolate cyclo-ligase, partial [Geminicoccaceae bacterium]
LDPRPTLEALVKRGAAGALPRVVGSGSPLDFHAWCPGDPLIEGHFKVMEPTPSADIVTPSILLVPLLAFDRACRRIGHGKGYYDRTLQELRDANPDLLAIGVAFAAQEVERVPTDAFDQTLDRVITERKVHRPI